MFNNIIDIDGVKIGQGCKPYIIAEMSANHGNDLNTAKKIIKEAKKCGADAVKIQTYTADTITIDCKLPQFEAKGAWQGQYLYDLYVDASTPWEWTQQLIDTAKEVGITLFSSPFDFSAVEFLEKFDMPAYKIASPELVDLPLVRKIAQTKKPIIISTGNATISQINDAVAVLIQENVKDLVILKCTSEYPADPKDINLKTIPFLKDMFKCPVGLSDHTLGTTVPLASIALGASVIEKHFILNSNYETADSFFSATPNQLKQIVDGSKMVQEAIGTVSFPIVQNRSHRSLVVIKDINEGETFQENINFRSIRPGGGIESKYIDNIKGRKAAKNIKRGTLLSWDLVGGF
jgi:pseudaminic acid synthase